DRGPAESAQENLGATVLGLADDLATCPKALVAEPRGRNADAVDVACWQPNRARQPDIERIQVRALAAEVAGLQHRCDVADAAAARLRIAESIIDDPLINAARLLNVAEGPAHDLVAGRFHDAMGRHQLGRGSIEFALIVRERRRGTAAGEIDRAVARGDATHHFRDGRALAVGPFAVYHVRPVLGVAEEHRRLRVGRPFVAQGLRPAWLCDRRQRQPGLRLAGRLNDLDARGDLELAPAIRPGGEWELGPCAG